jgi:hypothetical protein
MPIPPFRLIYDLTGVLPLLPESLLGESSILCCPPMVPTGILKFNLTFFNGIVASLPLFTLRFYVEVEIMGKDADDLLCYCSDFRLLDEKSNLLLELICFGVLSSLIYTGSKPSTSVSLPSSIMDN